MRSGRPLRSRPPTATPYHALSMSAGVLLPGNGTGVFRRGVNFRLRVLLVLCVAIVACVLLANVLFIRRERSGITGSLLSKSESGKKGHWIFLICSFCRYIYWVFRIAQ